MYEGGEADNAVLLLSGVVGDMERICLSQLSDVAMGTQEGIIFGTVSVEIAISCLQ